MKYSAAMSLTSELQSRVEQKIFETRMTVSIVKQDPRFKRKLFIRTKQKQHVFW